MTLPLRVGNGGVIELLKLMVRDLVEWVHLT